MTTRWLLTCEHGGHEVPAAYARLFDGAEQVLASHRGWDPGALAVHDALAERLADRALPASVTRLLVDLNRSLHNPRCFSEWTRPLSRTERTAIAAEWWRPWRGRAEGVVARWISAGHEVMHVSVHSFTPSLEGVQRRADLALLYDPSRGAERAASRRWRDGLRERGWRVRMNYPYRGVDDGHTTALRRRFGMPYAGIELELNQALLPARHDALVAALREVLAGPRR